MVLYVALGAYGGVGSALCRRLARKGATCCWQGETEHRLATMAAELDAQTFSLDATNLGEVLSCIKRASELYDQVSGVANCVGSLLLKPAHLLSEEEWDATITTNLKSAFAVVRAATARTARRWFYCAALHRRGAYRTGKSLSHFGS